MMETIIVMIWDHKKETLPDYNNILVVSDFCRLTKSSSVVCGNDAFFFDYLIIGSKDLIAGIEQSGILLDRGIPVTNYYQQTSIENIYFLNENSLHSSFKRAYDHIRFSE